MAIATDEGIQASDLKEEIRYSLDGYQVCGELVAELQSALAFGLAHRHIPAV